MKKIFCALSFGLLCAPISLHGELVNKIVARVNGINLFYSSLHAIHLDGKQHDLEQLIADELYVQEAVKHKIMPTVVEVEKQIAAYKTANGVAHLSADDFDQHLRGVGFTLKRYKTELARYIGSTSLLSHEVRSRVFVTTQEVESYCARTPEYTEDQYLLKTALLPFPPGDKKDAAGLRPGENDWVMAEEWMNKSDISEHMTQIFTLKKGEISKPIMTDYGYQFVMVVNKKPARKKTVKERYVAVENKLRTQKMENFEKEFKAELISRAIITYL